MLVCLGSPPRGAAFVRDVLWPAPHRVLNSRIGGSGPAACVVSPGAVQQPAFATALLPVWASWLCWASELVCPFFVHLLLLATGVLLRLLFRPLRGSHTPLGQFCFFAVHGTPDAFLLPLGHLGAPRRVTYPAQVRRRRPLISPASRQRLGICGRLLTLLLLPQCIWAAPTGWSEAVEILIAAALLYPDPMTAIAAAPAGSASGDRLQEHIELCESVAASECRHILTTPLYNAEHIPAPRFEAGGRLPEERPEVTAVFRVFAPHYHHEDVTINMRMPCPYSSVLSVVQSSLQALNSEFGQFATPALPQLAPDYGAFVLVPSWVSTSGMQVVLFDFSALGGHNLCRVYLG